MLIKTHKIKTELFYFVLLVEIKLEDRFKNYLFMITILNYMI
jgi:hypothetical protein